MSGCTFNFTAEVPWGCATELFSSYRAGKLLEDKSTNIQTVAQALGQVGAMLRDSPQTFASSEIPQDLESCIARVEEAAHSQSHSPHAMAANPLLLAIFLKALQLLMEKLLKS